MYFCGYCGLAPKKCLLEFLSENSGGKESATSQHSPIMLQLVDYDTVDSRCNGVFMDNGLLSSRSEHHVHGGQLPFFRNRRNS